MSQSPSPAAALPGRGIRRCVVRQFGAGVRHVRRGPGGRRPPRVERGRHGAGVPGLPVVHAFRYGASTGHSLSQPPSAAEFCKAAAGICGTSEKILLATG